MKVKTSELTGEQLNYAVGIAEYGAKKVFINPTPKRKGIWVIPQKNGGKNHFHPSRSFAQGGAIIQREGISVIYKASDNLPGTWDAYSSHTPHTASGDKALIAAMRCHVAAKLGEEVEVPDELV